jgi:hypothetical protein
MAQRVATVAVDASEVLARLGVVPKRYLLYPANFWRHKNHEMLLTAFGMAVAAGLAIDIKLVCTGAPGARQQWLQDAAGAMGLGGRVIFPGYLSNEELAALFGHCGGMVFPSLYEGFGLPVIEAMAAGVPVACSNATSLPEVAAEAAILVDPREPGQIAEAMIALLTDTPLRERLIAAGHLRAGMFADSERMAAEYWDLFLFAMANDRQENLLTGVHPDGWLGPSLAIQVAPTSTAQVVEFEFMAPDWLPHPRIEIRSSGDGHAAGTRLEVVRGATQRWALDLGPAGGHYLVNIGPTFVPGQHGYGDDQRELSLLLRECVIRRSGGHDVQLFPGEGGA